jgi:hypothetical protein
MPARRFSAIYPSNSRAEINSLKQKSALEVFLPTPAFGRVCENCTLVSTHQEVRLGQLATHYLEIPSLNGCSC